MLSLGVVLQGLTSLPLWFCVIIGTAASLLIVAKGGLRSDVSANLVQVVLMYAGFGALAAGCILNIEGVSSMVSRLPDAVFDVPGSIGWTGVAVWVLIAMQTFVDPNFHMRTSAARTATDARRGLLYSVVGWVVFDGLQLVIGLYGIAFASDGNHTGHFLSVAQLALPDVWRGLFVASVVSAVMSSLDGYALVSATTIGYDLLPGRGPNRERRLVLGLVLTGIAGSVAAITIRSITDLISMAASITVPGLLLPMLMAIWPVLRRIIVTTGIIPPWLWIAGPSMIAAVFTVLRLNQITNVEPMFVGLLVSVALAPFTRMPHATRKRPVLDHQ